MATSKNFQTRRIFFRSVAIFSASHLTDNLTMVTGLAHALADKPTSATLKEQSHQQVHPTATARGLTSPARLFSFVSFVVTFIRLVAARTV